MRSDTTVGARSTGAGRTARRFSLLAGLAASAGLAGFHAVLLWERIHDLTILQPLVALEWLGAGVLLVALGHLRRQRVPLLRGRKALAFWLLVLLLHLIAAPAGAVGVVEPGGLWLALPASWLLLRAVARKTVALRGRAATLAAPALRRRRPAATPSGVPRRGFSRSLFARPPPFVRSV